MGHVMHRHRFGQSAQLRTVLNAELLASPSARYLHKLHCVLLVTTGMSCCVVADKFGESSRNVQRWIKAYEDGGIDSLKDGPHTGRKARLPASRIDALEVELRAPPPTLGYRQRRWTGALVAEHVAKQYGVRLGVRQCQRLLHRFHPQ